MILTCPTCGTRYQTDRARLAPPGENVRCAKCLAVWFQAISDAEETPESDPSETLSTTNSAETGLQEKDPVSGWATNRTRLAFVAGWGALLIFVGTFTWAAIEFRHEIATVWPESSSFYAAINLPVNVQGLALIDVGYDRVVEEGESVLRISGRVTNVSEIELAVPGIRVRLADGDERELYAWTISAGISVLGPGQSRPFLTRLANPPTEMRGVDLSFANDGAP